jgi:transcriptional regulator with XRE-family HTH domain
MQEKSSEKNANRQLFSVRFRKLRTDLHLTQHQLSEKLGFSTKTQVSKFENGGSEPNLEILRKLVDISSINFPLDLHELITGKESLKIYAQKVEYQAILLLLAKYIAVETARLLEERHRFWGELGDAETKKSQGIAGQEEYVQFLKADLHRLEKRIADVAEDQHYIQEAMNNL